MHTSKGGSTLNPQKKNRNKNRKQQIQFIQIRKHTEDAQNKMNSTKRARLNEEQIKEIYIQQPDLMKAR